jgi:protein-disulfide isomerase
VLAMLSVVLFRVGQMGSRSTAKARIGHHAPWVYGRPDAPFTIIEYADLECPYCRAYFPVLRRWIREHPQINWEWWNLPLGIHDPAASHEAMLVECVGEVDGNQAFWRAIAWIYRHTRGNGAAVAAGTQIPGISSAIRTCLETSDAEKVIRAQAAEASRQHIVGTPTLRIVDQQTGQSLELQGPVADDSLLSAIDSLAAIGPRHMLSAAPR